MEKRIVMFLAAAMAAMATSAAPTVTDVTAKQRYPWNGLVDIVCTVSGIEGTASGYRFAVVAVDKDSGREYAATHFSIAKGGANVLEGDAIANGSYDILWDARTDMGQVVCERMAMRVTLEMVAGEGQLWEGGPYWANRNVGADKPWDYGLYFWWGDTTGHRPSGTTFTFNFNDDNSTIYTCDKSMSISELQSAGWVTSNGVLAPSHDAAHVKWGGNWRMPTYQEFSDLLSKCDWTWTILNGVNGCIVRGRGAYASNSIFLPCAGFGYGTSLKSAGSYGTYWSSVPGSDYVNASYYGYDTRGLYFHSSDHWTDTSYRYFGSSVRPVQGFAE